MVSGAAGNRSRRKTLGNATTSHRNLSFPVELIVHGAGRAAGQRAADFGTQEV
jgi:hypothetical protein